MKCVHPLDNGTDCQREARWRPVMLLRFSKNSVPVRAHIPHVFVCDECKPKLTLDDLLCDDGWECLERGMSLNFPRMALPARGLTKLSWLEIEEEEEDGDRA